MNGIASIQHDQFEPEWGGIIQPQQGKQVYADDEVFRPYYSGIAAPLGKQAQQLARLGRGEDKMLLHVTPDELETFQLIARQNGGSLTINPHTGLPEMGFLSKLWKGVKKVAKKVWKAVKPVIGPVAAIGANILMPGISPMMTGLISGAASGIANGSLKKGLTDGLMAWGGAHLFGGGGGAANAASAAGNSHMISGAANAAGSGVADTIGSAVANAGMAGGGSGIAGTIGNAVSQAGGAGIYGGMYSAPAAATAASGGIGSLGGNSIIAATQPASSAAASQAMGQVASQGPSVGASQGWLGRLKGLAGKALDPKNIPLTMVALQTAGNLMASREQEQYEEELRRQDEEQRRRVEEQSKPMYDHTYERPAYGGGSSMPSNPYYMMSGGGHNYGFQYARGGSVKLDAATQKKVAALRKRYRSMQQALDDARVPGSVAHSLGIHPNDPALRAAFGYTKKQGPKRKKQVVTLASGGEVGLGSLRGPGDGMSDDINATIDGEHPARLSDGEFVVPADVVSHLGNGSNEAGARQLYGMLDRVRMARTGRVDQAPRINPTKLMPV